MANPTFDERPFVRLDHGMPENPKVAGLTDAGFRLYIEVLCWCSRQETDGLVPEANMKRLGPTRAVTEVVRAGLVDRLDLGGFVVHDYLEHQRSKAEIDAFRASRSDRGKSGNHQRWHIARRKYDKDCEFCVAEAIADGSHGRSLNPSDGIADADADSDAAFSSKSPWSSSSSPVTRGAGVA